MDEDYVRYAVYFAPKADSQLADFARAWLGRDAETGHRVDPPSQFVESPRRYGFHATLKAPMRLIQGKSFPDLQRAVARLANEIAPVELGVLKLDAIGSFLALVTDRNHHDAVSDIAWRCVTGLDYLRAPLSDAERDKRSDLTESERADLEEWGYPYVGAHFRFHMTLTSSLAPEEIKALHHILESQIPEEPTRLDSLAIFGDPGGLRPFELLERYPLRG